MAHGIEVRVPFLDRKIIDFSTMIIPELGISHKKYKIFVKKYFEKLCSRKFLSSKISKGFHFDLNGLLKNELKEDFRDTLLSQNLFGNEFIDSKVVHDMVNNFYTGKENE